ncbi:MAG: YezD family protein [Novosphingobium sp.]
MSEVNRSHGVTVEEGLATIRDALSAIAYGSLVLTVHEGRVVQIDVTQRKRFKLN